MKTNCIGLVNELKTLNIQVSLLGMTRYMLDKEMHIEHEKIQPQLEFLFVAAIAQEMPWRVKFLLS